MLLCKNSLQRLLPVGLSSWSSKRWCTRNLPKKIKFMEEEIVLSAEHSFKFKNSVAIFSFLQRTTLTWAEIKNWFKWKKVEAIRADHRFLPARHETLGPDLATAHFITFRDGKVKFKGSNRWFSNESLKNGKIPSTYDPHFIIEGVDASNTNFCFETFDNLVHLYSLKELILRHCNYVDDWCLSRLHVVEGTLEYLDISGCSNVTERGICTIHRLKKLKRLILRDTPKISNKELVCLLLEDALPHCKIVGVNYNDPALLKRLECYLKQDDDCPAL